MRVHDEFNAEWSSTSGISTSFTFDVGLEDDEIGIGWIAYSMDSLDGDQSMLVELVFDSGGILDWAMVPMTLDRAAEWEAANGLASIEPFRQYYCSISSGSTRGGWGEFWDGYRYYLTNPSAMDDDLETGFYVSGGIGVGAGVLAGGIVAAPVVAGTTFSIPTVTITTTTTGGVSGGGLVLGGTATTVTTGTVTVSGTTVVQAGGLGTAVYMSSGGGPGGGSGGGNSAGGGGGGPGINPARTELLRQFFRGETIANNPQNVEWLHWYRQVALDTLARYEAAGYTGSGVATQTQRLAQIAQQLAQWGL